jgi:hypothetical protein
MLLRRRRFSDFFSQIQFCHRLVPSVKQRTNPAGKFVPHSAHH